MNAANLCQLLSQLLLTCLVDWSEQEVQLTREVETNTGRVRGVQESIFGRQIYSFYGIPFAEPPIGNRRFKRPEPISSWTLINATVQPNSCHQTTDTSFDSEMVDMWNPNTPVGEDCLYLTIWTPRLPTGQDFNRFAVLLWIYGGGFYSGTSTLDVYDGRALATLNHVVVVSIQYRVGPFGFLFLDHEQAPGNVGLVDQQLAMKWVKENIFNFGGDPMRITLFGESAGAVSVSFHLLAPNSQPLFSSAILQSGSAYCPWATKPRRFAFRRSLQLAATCGCLPDDVQVNDIIAIDRSLAETITSCMRETDAYKLSELQWELVDRYFDVPLPPVSADGYFFPKSPAAIMNSRGFKKAPIMVGTVLDEGSYFLLYGFKDKRFNLANNLTTTQEEFDRVVRSIFGQNALNPNQMLEESVRFLYERSRLIKTPSSYSQILTNVAGDYEFACPTIKFADLYAKHGMFVYMYNFRHRSTRNPWPKWMGVMHGYELEFQFGWPLNATRNYTKDEVQLTYWVMQMFTNFAKSGNPNFDQKEQIRSSPYEWQWPNYNTADRRYLTLNTGELLVLQGHRFAECYFWNEHWPKIMQLYDNHTASLRNCNDRPAWPSDATDNKPPLLMIILASFSVILVRS